MVQPHLTTWLAGVPALMTQLAEEWDLTIGEPYATGAGGYVVRAERSDGTPAVLKLVFPHRESEHEADALERWAGNGAVQVLARDDERHALLLERCEPGTFLSELDASRALDILVGLLPRLWVSAEGFHTLVDEVEHWIDEGLEPNLVGLARELASSQGELVLTHQDLHGDNVLAAAREPWLVIDPKPLAAEREFQVAPIVRSGELGHTRRQALYRLDRLCADLALDRERARLWTIVQTTAWSEGATLPSHGAVLDWLA